MADPEILWKNYISEIVSYDPSKIEELLEWGQLLRSILIGSERNYTRIDLSQLPPIGQYEKFLAWILHGVKYLPSDFKFILLKNVAAHGSIASFNLVEPYYDIRDFLKEVIRYHNNELAKYIIMKHHIYNVTSYAIGGNNLEILKFLVNLGEPINVKLHDFKMMINREMFDYLSANTSVITKVDRLEDTCYRMENHMVCFPRK